jgi:hypothetical protein
MLSILSEREKVDWALMAAVASAQGIGWLRHFWYLFAECVKMRNHLSYLKSLKGIFHDDYLSRHT